MSSAPMVPSDVLSQSNLAPSLRSSQDARKVKTHNNSAQYFIMLNKSNREVPVGVENEKSALSRGFVHTDRQIKQDDPAAEYQPEHVERDPIKLLTDALQKIAEAQIDQKEINKIIKENLKANKK
jgi:hypothetical protein